MVDAVQRRDVGGRRRILDRLARSELALGSRDDLAERQFDGHRDALHVVRVGATAVDTKLDGIAVLELEWLALLAGQAQAHGVEEGALHGLTLYQNQGEGGRNTDWLFVSRM